MYLLEQSLDFVLYESYIAVVFMFVTWGTHWGFLIYRLCYYVTLLILVWPPAWITKHRSTAHSVKWRYWLFNSKRSKYFWGETFWLADVKVHFVSCPEGLEDHIVLLKRYLSIHPSKQTWISFQIRKNEAKHDGEVSVSGYKKQTRLNISILSLGSSNGMVE